METSFTPLLSLLGGGLIGLSAVLLMATQGRIMGVTGILAGIFAPESRQDLLWRVALVAGMISGPLAVWLISGTPTPVSIEMTPRALVVGGILVGVGVTLGAGCTSGHGVCGLARLSPRSLAATLTFMLTTAVTVFVLRHGMGG